MEVTVLSPPGIVLGVLKQRRVFLSGILDKFYFPQNILPKKIANGKEIQT